MNNRVRSDWGSGGWGWWGRGEQQGKIGTTVNEQQLKKHLFLLIVLLEDKTQQWKFLVKFLYIFNIDNLEN